MAYLIKKSRSRKSVRTRTVEAWLQKFFWRKRYQIKCKLK
jgi:hypothetical protein